jgi:hypothetical protein
MTNQENASLGVSIRWSESDKRDVVEWLKMEQKYLAPFAFAVPLAKNICATR